MTDRPVPGRHRVLTRLAAALVVALAAYLVVAAHAPALTAVVVAWAALALAFTAGTWWHLRTMTPEQTHLHATTEEPGRHATHISLVLASLASLGGVGVLLMAGTGGGAVPVEAIVGTGSVAASWLLVHMIFTLRYASAYFTSDDETPIDFGHTTDPDYQDFAYLSYTLGMTYQVSDTSLNTREIRRIALRHCLLSYLLGAVVVASTINLVVQLASTQMGG